MQTILFIVSGIAFIALCWILIRLWLKVFARSIMFVPSKVEQNKPEEFGVSYEDIMLPSANKKKIHLWFFSKENPDYTILYCHGNGGNISMGARLYSVLRMLDLNLQVCIFDYQGFGRSEGISSEKITYEDAESVYRFLCNFKKIPEEKIVIYGKSLGTGVAVHLAAQKSKIRALILQSGFTSMLDVARDWFPFLERLAKLFLENQYDSLSKISKIGCPILMFYGEKDDIILPENTKKLFAAAKSPKKLVGVPDALHGNVAFVDENLYFGEIGSFLSGRKPDNKDIPDNEDIPI